MSFKAAREDFTKELDGIREDGLWKEERIIVSQQQNDIRLADGSEVVNMCANNYLGLANHPALIQAAKDSYDQWGFGLSSVRFICGTQSIHKQLETKVTEFLGMEDSILYAACFDANTGLFETLLTAEDAVISDELNHASIIDGVRLCKASRFRYKNNNMADLRSKLEEARKGGARRILITTDGVFSMDGSIAHLDQICDLADEFDAMVHHDDCHAVGFMGEKGRGIHEYHHVMDRVDIITGTFGKALGGASGGYTSGRKEIIDLLRQRSRPYLFSNTLAPAICAASIKALDMLSSSTELRDQLAQNTAYFR
ncbi:MAG TPA: glycine C-acetyltransferase, partial [Thiolapillus brandeum]|nr:glycine C-acetyltransferase [Thiolapillus brandeum]